MQTIYRKFIEESNNLLLIINILDLTDELKDQINQKINEILDFKTFEKDFESNKKKFLGFYNSKSQKQKKGIVAEFFVHLYLINQNYEIKKFLINLEDNSMTKGFDGVYTNKNDFWIMESKSGDRSDILNKHIDKLNEAYKYLENNLSSGNDPYRNSIAHFLIRQENKNSDLYKKFEKLSDDFEKGIFHDISEFNIIASGTLYLNSYEYDFNSEKTEMDVNNFILENHINNSIFLCITQKSKELLISYLES